MGGHAAQAVLIGLFEVGVFFKKEAGHADELIVVEGAQVESLLVFIAIELTFFQTAPWSQHFLT